jgi:hypothetical protein
MGAALVGITRRGRVAPSPAGWLWENHAGCGEMRPQPTAPERQSWSSQRAIVVGDAGRQQRALPLDGGGLETFELVQRLQDALFAGELRLRREMLPAQQPAHVDGGCDRLDLLARGGQREAVNALQDATLAPFDAW